MEEQIACRGIPFAPPSPTDKRERNGGELMQVKDIMTANPACCRADTPLTVVAGLMAEHDCGAIPVVNDSSTPQPVGIVTDRDIVLRAVAAGKDPRQTTADDCMSRGVVTVQPDLDVEDCARVMEDEQIRRVLVVDAGGALCGIVAQADLAARTLPQVTGEVVRQVSAPPGEQPERDTYSS